MVGCSPDMPSVAGPGGRPAPPRTSAIRQSSSSQSPDLRIQGHPPQSRRVATQIVDIVTRQQLDIIQILTRYSLDRQQIQTSSHTNDIYKNVHLSLSLHCITILPQTTKNILTDNKSSILIFYSFKYIFVQASLVWIISSFVKVKEGPQHRHRIEFISCNIKVNLLQGVSE